MPNAPTAHDDKLASEEDRFCLSRLKAYDAELSEMSLCPNEIGPLSSRSSPQSKLQGF